MSKCLYYRASKLEAPQLYPFDPTKVEFNDPVPRTAGTLITPYYPLKTVKDGQVVTVKVPVLIQTPALLARWGYQYRKEYKSHQIQVDINEDEKLFKKTLRDLEDKIKQTLHENRALWFVKPEKFTPEFIDDIFQGILKENVGRDGRTYDPSMKFKIKERVEQGQKIKAVTMADMANGQSFPEIIKVSDIAAGDYIETLFHVEKLWLSREGKIYCPLVMKQGKRVAAQNHEVNMAIGEFSMAK